MALNDGALESPESGASSGGLGLANERLEKFLYVFEAMNSNRNFFHETYI